MISIDIKDIISISALVLSVIGILYTRKNLKLSKYIETITNQRIKWIEIIREEFSSIISLAVLYKEYNENIDNANGFLESTEYGDLDVVERDSVNSEIEYSEPNLPPIPKINCRLFRE